MKAEVPEWQHQWSWYKGAGVDWKDWGLAFSVGFKWRNHVGASTQIGPFWAYVSLEEEDRLYINGVDQGCAVAPVDGYATSAVTGEAR